jgi:hypothetical protein
LATFDLLDTETLVKLSASGLNTCKVSFSDDRRCLICKGFVLGYIDGIGGVWEQQSLTESSKHSSSGLIQSTAAIHVGQVSQASQNILSFGEMSSLLDDLVCTLVLDRGDAYLREPVPIPKFRDAFLTAARSQNQNSTAFNQFSHWLKSNQNLLIRGASLSDILSAAAHLYVPRDPERFMSRLKEVAKHLRRRLATTSEGSLGMVPEFARKGDVICVLLGCSVPVILRERKSNGFEFIGEAYIHGFMNGEILSRENEPKEFALW